MFHDFNIGMDPTINVEMRKIMETHINNQKIVCSFDNKNSENTSSAWAYYAWVRISDNTMLKNMVIKTFQILNLPVAKHALLLIKERKSR